MSLSRQKLEELYDRYLNNQCTAEELQALLNELGDDSPEFQQERVTQLFDKTWDSLKIEPGKYPIKLRGLSLEVKTVITMPPRNKRIFTLSAVAAVLLAMITSVFFLYVHYYSSDGDTPVIAKRNQHPVVPGGNKAVLILGNGAKVDLNQAANGEISKAGNTSITKQQNGELVYIKSNNEDNAENELSFNTISTPRGGEYKVVLPDGSNVWLNAASSLKYPTTFKGRERHVELDGEAYFEVVKNKNMPFTITANHVNIQVLGTHFNVMAYDDEPAVNTTLLEGSVRMSLNNKTSVLKPGQQGIVSKNAADIILKTVNVDDAIAWKNHSFSFRKENLQTAMRKIARWYDVDVEYHGDMKNKVLGGSVSRAQNINELLDYLELTGIVNFKLEGRRIIVTPKP